ncbi:MAG: KTSC domain-containing protein [Planctomycetes bacterium RBG_13_60_9]|nr:MAG: KTSC domain-containing protein [Planctomycetes bacterium RBG_13_60_9]
MQRQHVASTNIRSVGYDIDSGTLEVEFTSGGIYDYFDVPEREYEALMRAPSKGSYLNQNIKDRYRYRQVG